LTHYFVCILSLFSVVEFNFLNLHSLIVFLIIVILIFFSAFISGTEVAFFSLNSHDIEEIEKKESYSDFVKLINRPNHVLATILIVNNFINVGIVILSAYLTSISIKFPEGSVLQFIFEVVVITFLLVLFGEITPKVYANANSRKFALLMAKPFVIIQKIFYPLSVLLVSTTSMIDKLFINRHKQVSIDEISKALDITEAKNKTDETRILRSILEFGNTDVKEVMKSRLDVIAIEEKTSFKKVIQIIISSGFSRIPIYKQQFDNVLGILYIKDLIPFLEYQDDFDWISLCREAYYVPENKMINDLLKEFQVKKNHIAIVVDEYGGTSGIVTLEDVLEEIVGEINDEFDEDTNLYSKLDDNNYIFEGKILLIDFLKIVKGPNDFFDTIKGDAESLAGLIIEVEGKILRIGESCVIHPYTILVESADSRKIKRVKVSINEK